MTTGLGVGTMAKKKTKNKAGKKPEAKETAKGEPNPAGMRKDLSLMVESQAPEMVRAAIDRGKMGELSTVKYLLEMAAIFPASKDGNEGSAEEESLAKTLLHRLNIPEEPVVADQDEEKAAETKMSADVEKESESKEPSGEPT